MKQIFRATLLHADAVLLHHLVSDATLQQIKSAGDPTPKIQIFSIGHEGDATPTRVTPTGPKRIRIKYLKDAVRKIAAALPKWTPAFFKHAKDSTNSGREVVGQVVGTAVRTLEGVLHTLAAVHVFPPHRDKTMNVASIEADCTYGTGEDGTVRMQEIHSVSGLALGDSEVDIPAFPGATLRANFQCFANTLEHQTNRGDEEMTKAELLQKIREANLSPTDIFSEDTLLATATIERVIERKVEDSKKETGAVQAKLDRVETRLQEAEERARTAELSVADLQKTTLHSQAEKLLKGLAEERKLGAPATAFAVSGLDTFKSDATTEDGLKKDLDAFLESQMKKRDSFLEIEGIESKEDDPKGDDKKRSGFAAIEDEKKAAKEANPVVSPDNEFAVDYKEKLKTALSLPAK